MNKIYQKLLPTDKNIGFTLIELLVVVLIIGILAAVAVPLYEQVVFKSRYAEAMQLVSSFYRAQQSYKMANGKYAWDLYSLDIDPPSEMEPLLFAPSGAVTAIYDPQKKLYLQVATGTISSETEARNPEYIAANISYGGKAAYYKMNFDGRIYCVPNEQAVSFCQKITGSKESAGSWGAHSQIFLFKN